MINIPDISAVKLDGIVPQAQVTYDNYQGEALEYDGKYYLLTMTGCAQLGYDLYQKDSSVRNEVLKVEFYQALCSKHHLTDVYREKCHSIDSVQRCVFTVSYWMNNESFIKPYINLLSKIYTNVTQKCNAKLDYIDKIFQKHVICNHSLKIRRLLTVSTLVSTLFMAGAFSTPPVFATSIGVLLAARYVWHREQTEPLCIDEITWGMYGHSTNSKRVINTTRNTGIIEKLFFFFRRGVFSGDSVDITECVLYPNLRFVPTPGTQNMVLANQEWRWFFQTILYDHNGYVTYKKKTYQIRRIEEYKQFIQAIIPEFAGNESGFPNDFERAMMLIPSYFMSIPKHLRLP